MMRKGGARKAQIDDQKIAPISQCLPIECDARKAC